MADSPLQSDGGRLILYYETTKEADSSMRDGEEGWFFTTRQRRATARTTALSSLVNDDERRHRQLLLHPFYTLSDISVQYPFNWKSWKNDSFLKCKVAYEWIKFNLRKPQSSNLSSSPFQRVFSSSSSSSSSSSTSTKITMGDAPDAGMDAVQRRLMSEDEFHTWFADIWDSMSMGSQWRH